MESLGTNEEIVTKPSDKGGNLVIMDEYQYVAMLTDSSMTKTHMQFLRGTVRQDMSLNLNLF